MILQSDARHIPLADASVQCCITSPPYWGLRDYGVTGQLGLERTPEEYVASLVVVFREVKRVLRDDGTLWLNMGDSYAGSSMSGGVGSGTIHGSEHGSRKGGDLRFTGVRDDGLKPKDLVGIPWRIAFALQADGWWLRSDIIWAKPNPMPESVTDRPTKSHEYIFLLTKSARYFFDADAVREEGVYPPGVVATGSLGRFGRDEKFVSGNAHRGNSIPITTGTRNLRSVLSSDVRVAILGDKHALVSELLCPLYLPRRRHG